MNQSVFEPINCNKMVRALDLCSSIPVLIQSFLDAIHYKDSNQLFQDEYRDNLIVIIESIEELISIVAAFSHPKAVYLHSINKILKTLTATPNSLIVAAYHLDRNRVNKRLLNKHIFTLELTSIERKIRFVKAILEHMFKGEEVKRLVLKTF
ncbi:hypothetical protein [Acinetobacter sp. CAAS 2-6]|uniref:hypothetical protein n=1 Tax=Acinetobacter sp. CAAS 2-6 TaxID=3016358 RepID=UPI002DD65611|nr:hypothetical protein [Acinetobacter sp. CAAS 2-6]